MPPVRVLAIMEDPDAKQSVIDTLQPLIAADRVVLTIAEDMNQAMGRIVRDHCPFDLCLCEVNYSEAFRQNDVRPLSETMQTGHSLSLAVLNANPNVRCIVAIHDALDISKEVRQYESRALQIRVRAPNEQGTYNWMFGIHAFYPELHFVA